jgi:hypothetical protein
MIGLSAGAADPVSHNRNTRLLSIPKANLERLFDRCRSRSASSQFATSPKNAVPANFVCLKAGLIPHFALYGGFAAAYLWRSHQDGTIARAAAELSFEPARQLDDLLMERRDPHPAASYLESPAPPGGAFAVSRDPRRLLLSTSLGNTTENQAGGSAHSPPKGCGA